MQWLFLAIALVLARCYETDNSVILASHGIRVPIESPITWDDGDQTIFRYVAATKEYRFRDDDGGTGSARAIHIRDDIYLLQVRYDDQAVYRLYFFQITSTRIDIVHPVGDLGASAKLHEVVLVEDFEFVDYILYGPSQNILAFLKDHAMFDFKFYDD